MLNKDKQRYFGANSLHLSPTTLTKNFQKFTQKLHKITKKAKSNDDSQFQSPLQKNNHIRKPKLIHQLKPKNKIPH